MFGNEYGNNVGESRALYVVYVAAKDGQSGSASASPDQLVQE